ncbi:hypothetical protein C2G38_2292884 [Gigaspora rosea]|uniref:Uncharacterized protein n=1 Tax=Gigaspora rosea TaxID=44941 RepID=A0A397TV96_9GLOM|nr:hypothetical protein C2G38_2292884 [Gigaspora rosea]
MASGQQLTENSMEDIQQTSLTSFDEIHANIKEAIDASTGPFAKHLPGNIPIPDHAKPPTNPNPWADPPEQQNQQILADSLTNLIDPDAMETESNATIEPDIHWKLYSRAYAPTKRIKRITTATHRTMKRSLRPLTLPKIRTIFVTQTMLNTHSIQHPDHY